mmetsp:Transcript_14818/g.13025  ORF Transcript_14818/g.13025 Transcript_14818/m.13025 type:complete len:156 (+) Transcript_14818:206-673(+)
MIDNIIEKVKACDRQDLKLIETMNCITNSYCYLGKNKLEILENSFDMFLENMLMGKDFKGSFYSCDKEIPQNFAEMQSYLKMKKFQKYDKYPDEKVRDFIDVNLCILNSEEEYKNFLTNKIPALKQTKEEMKVGINKLFEAKEIVYKALMRSEMS